MNHIFYNIHTILVQVVLVHGARMALSGPEQSSYPISYDSVGLCGTGGVTPLASRNECRFRSILENCISIVSKIIPLNPQASLVRAKERTMLFWRIGTTPSLIQKPQPPIIFASIMSVVRRSPTTATCDGSVTPVSGCCRK